MNIATSDWSVIVPIKAAPAGKSRLVPPDGVAHDDLARALALDTLTATAGAGVALRVVTADPVVSAYAGRLGAHVVPDPGAGLLPAVAAGLAGLRAPLAVLLGDLPSLQPGDLVAALAACSAYRAAFVPDHAGAGTVLLTGRDAAPVPRFGPRSADAHAELATRIELDLPRLRLDVDDAGDLRRARRYGVGPHTSQVLSSAAEGPVLCRWDAPRAASPPVRRA